MLSIKTIDNLTKDAIEKAINDYKKAKRASMKNDNDDIFKFGFIVNVTSHFVTNQYDIENYTARYLLFYFYNEEDGISKEFIKNFGRRVNNYLDSIHLFTVYDLNTLDSWGEIKGKEELRKYFLEFEGDSIINRFNKLKEIGDSYGVDNSRYPAILIYDIETKNQAIRYYDGANSSEIYTDIKDIISNINENYGELDLNSIGYVSSNNNISDLSDDFLALYEKYSKSRRGIKTQIAAQFGIEYSTLYRRITSYNLYSLFTRDEIIMISLMFNLDKIKTNEFIKSYHLSKLDDNDPRDHIILNGIECGYTIEEINNVLDNNGFEILRADKKKKEYY